jgi:hypothetical protein
MPETTVTTPSYTTPWDTIQQDLQLRRHRARCDAGRRY